MKQLMITKNLKGTEQKEDKGVNTFMALPHGINGTRTDSFRDSSDHVRWQIITL